SLATAPRDGARSLSRWDGSIELARAAWQSIAAENIAATFSLDPQRFELTRARARVAAVPLEVTGGWPWAGEARAKVLVGPVALGSIAGVRTALDLAGTGRGQITVSTERGVVSTEAAIDLERVSAHGVALGDGRLSLRGKDPALSGALAFPARKLRAEARGRLESGALIETRVELADLPLRPLLAELGAGASGQVDGLVSAHGELSIPVDRPADGSGVVRVEPANLRLLGEPWASRRPAVIRWQSGQWALEPFRLDRASGTITASGTPAGGAAALALAPDRARPPGTLASLGEGSARADARVDRAGLELTRLVATWPALSATAAGRAGDSGVSIDARVEADLAKWRDAAANGVAGRATLSAALRGRRDALEVTGQLRAARIEVRGAALTDLEVPFRAARGTLRVDGAQARLGAGQIAGSATAAWTSGAFTAESMRHDVRLTADPRAPAPRLPELAARLEALAPFLPAAARGAGEFSVRAHAEGTPAAWRGTGSLAGARVDLGAAPLRQVRASLTFDEQRVDLGELTLEAYGVPVRGTGT